MNITIDQKQYEFLLTVLEETDINWFQPMPRMDHKKELIEYLQLQYDEQLKGGPWKARLREQGYVI